MAPARNLSYRRVMVEGIPTGMAGLDELFAELAAAGRAPDPSLGPELVRRAAEHNYIVPGHEEAYAEALLREYRRHWEQRTGQGPQASSPPTPQTWRGHPRHEIPWYPTIYADRCDGCGDCVTFCQYGVFAPNEASGKVLVVEPFRCLVGCEACVRVCTRGAIAFPPRDVLARFSQHRTTESSS